MKRGRRRWPPVRVGAMQRPRDVCPGRVPTQILCPDGSALETDIEAELVDAAALAKERGLTVERVIEQILRSACRRVIEEGLDGE